MYAEDSVPAESTSEPGTYTKDRWQPDAPCPQFLAAVRVGACDRPAVTRT